MPPTSARSALLAIVMFVAAGPTRLVAQDSVSREPHTAPGITLTQALAMARDQNADVALAAVLVDSARAERRIAAELPNPTISGSPNSPYQYTASIPLDIMPERHYRVRAAERGATASEADRLDVMRQTTANVARAFYDALLAQEKLRLALDQRDVVRQVLTADSVRLRAGDIPERSVVRSEVELARSEADVARASDDVYASRLDLQTLIGAPHPDTAAAAIGDLTYRRLNPVTDSLLAQAKLRRPDLAASTDRVEQSESSEHAAAALVIPTPQIVYARQSSTPFDNGHLYELGFAFELPLLNSYGPQRQRATAGRVASEISHRRIETQVERDVISAAAEFRTNRALVERYGGGLVAKMAESVTAARYAYTHGATSLLDVLDAVQADQDVQVEYATALHDYWVSMYALNAAVGTDVFSVRP